MKRLITFFARQGVFADLLAVSVIGLGIVSAVLLQRDVFPNVQFDIVTITTIFPGASPSEIEKLITVPLEEAIDSIDKIKMVTSTSSEGLSQISIQFETIGNDEFDKLYQDLKSEIDQIDDLPRPGPCRPGWA